MTEALAAILGVGATGALVAVIVLAFKLVGSKDEQLAARDMLDKEREELRKVRGELDVETAAHAATRVLLAEEKDLRAVAESQRNQAWNDAREHLVTRIKESNVADAQMLIARLLGEPLPGMQDVPEGRATAPGPDALIDLDL